MPRTRNARRTLTESTQVVEATPVDGSPGRFLIQLITPGWGTSGYYSQAVLEAAATDRVFGAGLHMYLDHPRGDGSMLDVHGNRSVRDLGAVLAEDAYWSDDLQALVAEATVFGPYREILDEMKEDIGVSVRAYAEASMGSAENRRGAIVDRIDEAISVDFVTRAGRGGKILQLIESARPEPIGEATANELREWLDTALRDAYGGDKVWVWVRDFDESTVWYCHETPDESGTYAHTYDLSADDVVTLTGEPVEVRPEIKYVPVNPAGQPTTEGSEEDTMPNIEESRLRELEEAHGRVPTLESERDAATERATVAEARAAEAERERDAERARGTAVTHARARVTESNADLAPAVVERIVAEATRTIPMTESGELDTAALDSATDAARTREETYLASLAESSGTGRVRGLGRTSESTRPGIVPEGTEVSEGAVTDMIKRRAGVAEKTGA